MQVTSLLSKVNKSQSLKAPNKDMKSSMVFIIWITIIWNKLLKNSISFWLNSLLHGADIANIWLQSGLKSLKHFKKEIHKVHLRSKNLAKIAEVDCTKHQAACQQNGIRGYPTMLWFQKGKEGSEKYAGARSTEAFVNWINQKIVQSK